MIHPKVTLVGAGPGDPELLTVKAVRAIEAADVVVYDRLIGDGILDLAPPRCERRFVGKAPGRHSLKQEQINALLVELAVPGRRVVRLKGGDPFVFGRGGEEAQALQAAGVEVEVVPGITAALGIAASARIPLTHRGVATSVRFVTGHCRAGWWLDLDWSSLAARDTTLVFYMGLSHVGEIADHLMAAGLSATTPAAGIAEGTTATQRVVRTTLGRLADAATRAQLTPPTLFVIGDVVNVLHDGIDAVLRDVPRAHLIDRVAHA